jgi:MFS family permease
MIKIVGSLRQIFERSALRHPDFRRLWVTTLLSSTARWADLVVVGWLTLELTDSALMVGVVTACKMAGYLLAPMIGVAADRLDRRKLLILASVISGLISVMMLVLLTAGWLTIGYLIGLSLVSSLTWALDNPTRQAYIPDLVEPDDLTNAIATNSVAIELTVIVGPALGGLLIPILGITGAYWLIAIVYCLDLFVLLRLRGAKQTVAKIHEPPFKSLLSGFHYAWNNHAVLVPLLIALMLNLFVAPYRYSFLPVFAHYILDAGPAGYGFLTSMAGCGALVTGLWLVSQKKSGQRGRLLVVGGLVWPFTLFLFSLSTSYYLSLLLIFLAGIAQAICWTMIATLILSNTEQSMRGRVMGIRTGVIISLPFGNLLAGAAAQSWGPSLALGAYAGCAMLIMGLIFMLMPKLRHLD